MAEAQESLQHLYEAFNKREIDRAFAFLHEDVSWPKASEGGRVVGKEAIRGYWSRQWAEFDPHVEPIEVLQGAAGKLRVRVHQVVKSLGGEVLFDGEVWHVYTLNNGLFERMELGVASGAEQEQGGVSPTQAFARE